MNRVASSETELRKERSENRVLRCQVAATEMERNQWHRRAEAAEKELAEWKLRFDRPQKRPGS